MNFNSVTILKHPVDIAWNTMLHALPEIAIRVDELESITETERNTNEDGTIKVVSLWIARPKVPAMVMKYIKPEMLEWNDIAVWLPSEKKIEWEIFSHHFHEQMKCSGYTQFEPAMGGRGCKLSFSGNLNWNGKIISSGLGFIDNTVAKGAEGILTQLIPSNFRKITDALDAHIKSNS